MMTDVYIVVFSLIGILISLPALLVALNLLFPKGTGRAAARLQHTPVKCFLVGLPLTFFLILTIMITANAGIGFIRTLSFITTFVAMALGTFGAAGLARVLGQRIARTAAPNSDLANLIRGAIVYELSCLFPIVGWFIFIPVAGITLLGAAAFAVVGWVPQVSRPEAAAVPAGSSLAMAAER